MLMLHSLHQIVQIVDDPVTECLKGEAMNSIKIMECRDNSLAVFCDANGKIGAAGAYHAIIKGLKAQGINLTTVQHIDCKGGSVVPGLVDGHTHPVFAGDRVHEFAMKLAGATYMEVQKAGGGILFTMTKTREASEDQLLKDFKVIANEMIKSGTTLLEAKSGYGLDKYTELKQLRVLETASKELPLEISATFCGAHAVPKGSTEEAQTKLIVEEVLPEIQALKEKGDLKTVENIDVFCEKGVFELESSQKILEAGQKIGLRANFHADELNPLGGAEMGAKIVATAMSHLEEISDAGIQAMSSSGTVAVLLPSTAYILRLQPPPARKMIQAGVPVALGSDFNPNAYCLSMPTIMHLACVLFRMSMPEALVAATINAAHSLGKGRTHGAIAVGRMADLVVLNTPKWEHLVYRFGCHNMVIEHVIKNGKVVHSKS